VTLSEAEREVASAEVPDETFAWAAGGAGGEGDRLDNDRSEGSASSSFISFSGERLIPSCW